MMPPVGRQRVLPLNSKICFGQLWVWISTSECPSWILLIPARMEPDIIIIWTPFFFQHSGPGCPLHSGEQFHLPAFLRSSHPLPELVPSTAAPPGKSASSRKHVFLSCQTELYLLSMRYSHGGGGHFMPLCSVRTQRPLEPSLLSPRPSRR